MFRRTVPSMSFPAFLDVVVAARLLSVTSYVEVPAQEATSSFSPQNGSAPPVERSLRFTGPFNVGELPPKADGVYHERFPCARMNGPYRAGAELAENLSGRWFKTRSYSMLDLDDPSLGAGELSEGAVWTLGIDYEGYLRPFYNAMAFESSTKMHPMRSVRNLGGPSCFFVYQPFPGVPFSDCSMTLKFNKGLGFRSNLSGWSAHAEKDYLEDLREALPGIRVLRGGGDVAADVSAEVDLELVDAVGARLRHDAVLYLEETGGYLPIRRIDVREGLGRFRVLPLGLRSGETFKVKVGFRCVSGLADVEFKVRA